MPFFNHDRQRLFYRTEGSGPLLLVLPGNSYHVAATHADRAAEATLNFIERRSHG